MKSRAASFLALTFALTGALWGSILPSALPLSRPPFAATVIVTFDAQRIGRIETQGYADPFTKRPVSADDPVRIASVSKLIVALGVAELARTGKIDVNRDISAYLGITVRNPSYPETPITLAMLLSHTSSLTDDADYIIPLGEMIAPKFGNPKAWDAEHGPGHYFRYANFNYPVIATVMEKATGERFDRLMARLVFRPLKLDACFNWSTCSDAKAARAVVLTDNHGAVRKDDLKGQRPPCLGVNMGDQGCTLDHYQIGDNGGVFSPQGGARLSMRDLAKIGQRLFALTRSGANSLMGTVLKTPESALLTGESEKGFFCAYGFGVQLIGRVKSPLCHDQPFADGRARIGHAGEAFGLRSGLWIDPATGRGVAFFTTAVPDNGRMGPISAFTDREEWILRTLTLPPGKE
jgi:CubicO group peptidase (beta-lactamase class C family)